jgi:Trk K+ transport system NAD-binding subunit
LNKIKKYLGGKKMKKLVILLLTLVLALGCFTANVFAAGLSTDEQNIINTLSAPIQLNGSNIKVTIPAIYLAQAENYLQTVTLTPAQYSSINSQIQDAISVIKTLDASIAPNGVVDLNLIPKSDRSKILNDATAAASAANLNLTYDGTTLNITDKTSGNVVFTATRGTTAIKATGNPINPSVSTTTITLMSVLAVLLLLVVTIAYKLKLFSKVELRSEN